MKRYQARIDDEHVGKALHWDFPLRENFTVKRQELGPDHEYPICVQVVAGIEKVPAHMLLRRRLESLSVNKFRGSLCSG